MLLCEDGDGERVIRELEKVYQNEYRQTDPSIRLVWESTGTKMGQRAMTQHSTDDVIAALVNLPGHTAHEFRYPGAGTDFLESGNYDNPGRRGIVFFFGAEQYRH